MSLEKTFQNPLDIIEKTPIGFFTATPQGRYIFANPALARIYGYASPEDLMHSITDIAAQVYYDPADMEEFMRLLETDGEVVNHESRLLRKDGTVFWASSNVRAVRDQKGTTLYYQGVTADITDRKRAEEELRLQSLVLDQIEDRVVVTDLSGRITYVNQAEIKMTGFSRDEILNKSPDIYGENSELGPTQYEILEKTLQSGPWRGEVVNYSKDGSERIMDFRTQVVQDEMCQPVAFCGIATDITERAQAEDARQKLQVQLLQAQKMESIGILAGGIARDFNNLLHIISGNLELLGRGKPGEHPDQKRLRAIKKSIDRGSDLIKHLLLFGRKVEVRKQTLDLNLEIRHSVRFLERSSVKIIAVELFLDDGAWPIYADPIQVEQVLYNLQTNAGEAMPDGGRLIIETENVTLEQDYVENHAGAKPGRYVRMSVTDTGCGMDEKIRKQVFDPSFTTKEPGEGTGLGLPSVYGIVNAHEGCINCYSEPGKGTTFQIYWPAISEIDVREDETAVKITPEGGSETILVVEDEKEIREFTFEVLSDHGYLTITAASGEQALEIYSVQGENINLVLLDLSMPGMDGSQCLEEMLKINPEVKVLIASGYSANAHAKAIPESGVAGFIGKPFQVHELLVEIRKVLDEE